MQCVTILIFPPMESILVSLSCLRSQVKLCLITPCQSLLVICRAHQQTRKNTSGEFLGFFFLFKIFTRRWNILIEYFNQLYTWSENLKKMQWKKNWNRGIDHQFLDKNLIKNSKIVKFLSTLAICTYHIITCQERLRTTITGLSNTK